jgi:acyl-coenzyme A thioesterase PaaI-like protein
MRDLARLITGARTSGLQRWLLNTALSWRIPFNRPHGFRVEPLASGGIRVHVPYWRINRNHIRGIHACALATAAEFCSGLALLEVLDPRKYRLIMKTLHMDYHYQAKRDALAMYAPDRAMLEAQASRLQAGAGAMLHEALVELHDSAGAHLATGRITWQVKPWDQVRTSV